MAGGEREDDLGSGGGQQCVLGLVECLCDGRRKCRDHPEVFVLAWHLGFARRVLGWRLAFLQLQGLSSLWR